MDVGQGCMKTNKITWLEHEISLISQLEQEWQLSVLCKDTDLVTRTDILPNTTAWDYS